MNDPDPRGLPLPLIRWRGLTLQLFLFLVVPLTALLLAIVLASQGLHHQEMRTLIGERDLRAVRATASDLAHEITSRATALEMLAYRAGSPAVAKPQGWLDQAAVSNGFDGGLAWYGENGQLLAKSTSAVPFLLNLTALQKTNPQPVGAGYIAHLANPVQTEDGHWWVPGLVDIPQGGLLVGAFSPASLAREALDGVTSAQTTVLLLSKQGAVLYQLGAYNASNPINQNSGVVDVLRGESGVNYSPAQTGMAAGHSGEHVIAFSPVPPFGWGLVLEEPWEASAGPLFNLTQSAPLVLIPVLLLALLALWFGARQIVQPLQALETRARRLAAGDFSALRQPAGGISEIRNLQDELVNMAAALQSAQQALHAYIGALTAGLETERRSLARELHDDTLQSLIALNQHVQMALLQADPQQRQSLLDLQARVTETIANLRRAIGGLRPIYLEDLGLVAALGMLAQADPTEEPSASRPALKFKVSGAERRLSPEVELSFYRIAQEALNNAMHHSGARQVRMELAFEDQRVCLSVQDDGSGFSIPADPGAYAHLGHYGLLGMRERADLIGANFELESKPGQGTCVEVTKKSETPIS